MGPATQIRPPEDPPVCPGRLFYPPGYRQTLHSLYFIFCLLSKYLLSICSEQFPTPSCPCGHLNWPTHPQASPLWESIPDPSPTSRSSRESHSLSVHPPAPDSSFMIGTANNYWTFTVHTVSSMRYPLSSFILIQPFRLELFVSPFSRGGN